MSVEADGSVMAVEDEIRGSAHAVARPCRRVRGFSALLRWMGIFVVVIVFGFGVAVLSLWLWPMLTDQPFP